MLDDLKHEGETLEVWTSGIQLGDDLWTWFGEGNEWPNDWYESGLRIWVELTKAGSNLQERLVPIISH